MVAFQKQSPIVKGEKIGEKIESDPTPDYNRQRVSTGRSSDNATASGG
jgi:hypothetical protein